MRTQYTAGNPRDDKCCIVEKNTYIREGGEALNNRVWSAIAAATRGGAVPFIVFADWNVTPEEMRASHWPRLLQMEVLQPAAAELTCTAGKGRLLDFVGLYIIHLHPWGCAACAGCAMAHILGPVCQGQ